MEILGERPAWSMNDSEKLSRLDATVAVIGGLTTYYLQLIADLDASGYAKEIGAGDTARFLSERYLIDAAVARRDLRLANALPKYDAVSAALPGPAAPFPDTTAHAAADTDHSGADHSSAGPGADDSDADDSDADDSDADDSRADVPGTDDPGADDPGADDSGADGNESGSDPVRPINPAQANAIVSALEKVPNTVPAEDLRAAEEQLIILARTFTPGQLRDAGARMRKILDTDGPEPDENRAYNRESLTMQPADNGVKFRGYLANDNAELFRTLIHANAKPHKTIDGALDPRPRDKRQADALTTLLNTAAAVTLTTSAQGDRSTTPTPRNDEQRPNGSTQDTNLRAAAWPPDDDHQTSTSATSRSPRSNPSTATSSHGTSSRDTLDPNPTTATDADRTTATDPNPTSSGTAAVGSTATATGPSGSYIPGHGPKAHLTITIDYHALKTATADALGSTVFGEDLSAAAVRRLACDAQVIPVVLGSKSQPLDVGTTKRLVTAPMRLALNARDRGCVVCGAPPIQCEAHHLVHWIDGGETRVDNLVLLCKRHHLDLHSGHWHIHITAGIVHVTRPGWTNPAPTPLGKYKPPSYIPHTAQPAGEDPPGGPVTPIPFPSPNEPTAWPPDDTSAQPTPWTDTPHIPRRSA
ncbi:HNH endonuclease [Kribbella antiqua]|uniref:HNH endonuclease n=1 Tax=Kribbella antiqua TaxID=2512217 RepID=A0A4V2S4S5_9ACTN|nr:HNH endonuclease signature motif containing protein [Kribbella antiqua]TCO49360.1 HNH endonuclease [Kribbella antiqua]